MWDSLVTVRVDLQCSATEQTIDTQDVIELVEVGLSDDVIIEKINATEGTGKLESWHQSLKSECIRPLTPLTVEDARRLIQSYEDRYNTVCLAQRDRLCDTTRHASRRSGGDSCGARS
jgi:hypothetical protein